jgi:hypothetical protein
VYGQQKAQMGRYESAVQSFHKAVKFGGKSTPQSLTLNAE